jgi:hypothetical protein
VALFDDLLADRRIERAVHVVEQQPACVAVIEPADRQFRKACKDVIADAGTSRGDESDPLGVEAAGDEREDLRRVLVEPLRVIDDADKRLLLGNGREQRQGGEPDKEAVRRRAGAQREHRCKRVPLWRR